ncbi:MAG: hypothetical protein AB1656_01475 [Candidatus Omnitrophota bacterium]
MEPNERVEIYLIDEDGVLLRAYCEEPLDDFEGEPDALDSPLSAALGLYYLRDAPKTLVCKGYETPGGPLLWRSEPVTPGGEDGCVEIGERLFLVDDWGERFMDEIAYELLAKGSIPEEWILIERGGE